MCLFLDDNVVYYHLTQPVHPKFIVQSTRRRIMKLHLLSGALQCIIGPAVLALLWAGQDAVAGFGAVVIASWGFVIHVPTSMYLLTSAFGAVRIMMPGFLHATGMYAYTLARLLKGHSERLEEDMLAYWLVFHVYVFNRVVFGVLTKFNVLASARYTLAILLGLALAAPPGLGCMSIMLLLGAVVTFNMVFFIFMDAKDGAKGQLYSAGGSANEALVKRHFVAPEGVVVAPGLTKLKGAQLTREGLARVVFEELDEDSSGQVEMHELSRVLVAWGLPAAEADSVMRENDTNGDGRLNFEEFYQNMAPVWEFAARIVLSNKALEVPS
eukprot:gnl/TRDRNA2_/TRDRNA2_158138_c0_seq3.p1 gnl/TRDRNA2_/TRDRNA2_158138_c0~~gnl/TRDRNA2_/TRDRNA2_158138_c0_seq3.p1  ORF type:complete len:326 (-),score=66.15 gnl/TRDRNA2_/TRDRNA2_158138_c0_seq3:86-1063(-)